LEDEKIRVLFEDIGFAAGYLMPSQGFIHPTAIIDEGAEIGEGTRIWHWVHISAGARIGRNCALGQNVYIGGRACIGNNVRIQNNVSIYDDVTLEDDVFCGPSMVFTNVINPRAHVPRKNEYLATLVERGASIGANATVICGHTIGRYAFVGAGSVVVKDVPNYSLVVGVPSRHVGWICQCGVRLKKRANAMVCESCESRYEIKGASCHPLGER
jgi:UDP-2-acetamido-3-amino-2,3-dideoxy-glucuronate N-acetyltransferase